MLILILFIVSPIVISAGGADDDKTSNAPANYNVKCEYQLKSALLDENCNNQNLTTFSIYVDEANRKYKLTYLNKSGQEIDGKPNNNISDYQYYSQNDNMLIKYSDNSKYGGLNFLTIIIGIRLIAVLRCMYILWVEIQHTYIFMKIIIIG